GQCVGGVGTAVDVQCDRRLGDLGVERKAGAGTGSVAGGIGIADADRVGTLGQAAGVIASHGVAVDRDDTAGVRVECAERQAGVIGQCVAGVGTAVDVQCDRRLGDLGVERKAGAGTGGIAGGIGAGKGVV